MRLYERDRRTRWTPRQKGDMKGPEVRWADMCRLLIASGVALLFVMPPARAGAPQAPGILRRRSQSLAGLIASLSEPGGYFDTDNLISNERSYLHVVPALRALAGQAGGNGVYLGVGPDQNFSYIAHLRPTLAILIDIRRDNLLLHLLFKALFSEAATRADYLALLTGRSQPAATRDASIESLVRLVDEARPLGSNRARTTPGTAGRGHRRLRRAAFEHGPRHDCALPSPVRRCRSLPAVQLHRPPPQYDYPTYRDLLLEVDRDAVRRSFLANEEDFQFVKSLHARDRIVPIVGDLAGRGALANVGRYLDATGLRVSAFYTSNVEFYLFRDGSAQAFIANLARLPRQPGSVIVRSVFPGGGARHVTGLQQCVGDAADPGAARWLPAGAVPPVLGTGPIARLIAPAHHALVRSATAREFWIAAAAHHARGSNRRSVTAVTVERHT